MTHRLMFDYFRWKITLHITYLGSKQQPLGCRFCDAGVKGWGDFVWKLQSFICILSSLSAWKLVEVTLDNSLFNCTIGN